MATIPVQVGLPAGHYNRAAEVLTLAFQEDPVACYVLPEATRRRRVLRRMFRAYLRYGQRHGVISTTPDVEGVAIWLAPGQTTPTLGRLLGSGACLIPLYSGWKALRRSLAFMEMTTAWHQRYVPEVHWYLLYLGVTPDRQGQGIGSALLQPILARAETEALPCYLETGTARNVGFYERHGFQVLAEGALAHGGPRLWSMLRRPAALQA